MEKNSNNEQPEQLELTEKNTDFCAILAHFSFCDQTVATSLFQQLEQSHITQHEESKESELV